ncbi:MAG: hypothetical protein ACFCGT_20615 [Sandaracinaceae bacterium]
MDRERLLRLCRAGRQGVFLVAFGSAASCTALSRPDACEVSRLPTGSTETDDRSVTQETVGLGSFPFQVLTGPQSLVARPGGEAATVGWIEVSDVSDDRQLGRLQLSASGFDRSCPNVYLVWTEEAVPDRLSIGFLPPGTAIGTSRAAGLLAYSVAGREDTDRVNRVGSLLLDRFGCWLMPRPTCGDQLALLSDEDEGFVLGVAPVVLSFRTGRVVVLWLRRESSRNTELRGGRVDLGASCPVPAATSVVGDEGGVSVPYSGNSMIGFAGTVINPGSTDRSQRGRFALLWYEDAPSIDGYRVVLGTFEETLAPDAEPFVIAEVPSVAQATSASELPSLAFDGETLLATWVERDSADDSTRVRGRFLDLTSSDAPAFLSSPGTSGADRSFRIGDAEAGSEVNPVATAVPGGGFAVAYVESGAGRASGEQGAGTGVRLIAFDADRRRQFLNLACGPSSIAVTPEGAPTAPGTGRVRSDPTPPLSLTVLADRRVLVAYTEGAIRLDDQAPSGVRVVSLGPEVLFPPGAR